MNGVDVHICEVGLRDGLQSIAQVMPTEYKQRWIAAAVDAGLREIEVASFVPPKLLPQMADAAEVVAYALTLPGLKVVALAPNLKGALRAMECGAHRIVLPISVSRAHSLSNVRKSPEEAIAEAHEVVKACAGATSRPTIAIGMSTAFGCTIEGPVAEDAVVRMAEQLAGIGVDEIALADTTGYANPEQVRRLLSKVRAAIGDRLTAAHFHNTRGLGLANTVAALDAGIRNFDSSLAGLGGCPFAPGATGNVVTEDLVFMLEAMGLRTGIDVAKLVAIRDIVAAGVPGETLYGYIAAAGVPKGYRPAQ
jgi:hydroxymethylglutaryl-CoA lyase